MKRAFAAVCALAVLGILLVQWDYSYRPEGFPPRALVSDRYGSPEGWVAALIQREGGLPKPEERLMLTYYREEGA